MNKSEWPIDSVFTIVYDKVQSPHFGFYTQTEIEIVAAQNETGLREHIDRVKDDLGEVTYVFAGQPFLMPGEIEEVTANVGD